MKSIQTRIIHVFEIVAAIMMAAMFATFILQVTIRYTCLLYTSDAADE